MRYPNGPGVGQWALAGMRTSEFEGRPAVALCPGGYLALGLRRFPIPWLFPGEHTPHLHPVDVDLQLQLLHGHSGLCDLSRPREAKGREWKDDATTYPLTTPAPGRECVDLTLDSAPLQEPALQNGRKSCSVLRDYYGKGEP
eukprot:g32507.t1